MLPIVKVPKSLDTALAAPPAVEIPAPDPLADLDPAPVPELLRRSTRQKGPSDKMRHIIAGEGVAHLMHLMNKDDDKYHVSGMAKTHIAMACIVTAEVELEGEKVMMGTAEDIPQTFQDAMKRPDANRWYTAMQDEINCLKCYDTFKLVPPVPAGKKIVGGGWVNTIKHNSDGSIAKYCSRYIM